MPPADTALSARPEKLESQNMDSNLPDRLYDRIWTELGRWGITDNVLNC